MNLSTLGRGEVITVATLSAIALIAIGIALFGTLFFSPKDREFTFRQHWGGFGGSSTGWRASTPLMKFVAGAIASALGVCTLVYLLELPEWQPPANAKPATTTQTPAKPADKSATPPTTPPAAATGA